MRRKPKKLPSLCGAICVFALTLGCARERGAAPAHGDNAPAASPSATAATKDARSSIPSLSALEKTYAKAVPGMRKVAQREGRIDETTFEIPPTQMDECIRVAFVASAPIAIAIEDDSKRLLTESKESSEGLISPNGPVCLRRGSAARIVPKGAAGTVVRWVAWQSP